MEILLAYLFILELVVWLCFCEIYCHIYLFVKPKGYHIGELLISWHWVVSCRWREGNVGLFDVSLWSSSMSQLEVSHGGIYCVSCLTMFEQLPPSYYELLQRASHSNTPKMTSPSLITVPMFSPGSSITRDDEIMINDLLDTLFTPPYTSSSSSRGKE